MRFSLILSILLITFIWTNSLLPAHLSSEQSGFVVNLLHPVLTWIGISMEKDVLSLVIRKLAHFTQFFFLGITLTVYLFKSNKPLFFALWIGFMVACIDEFIQLFVDGRNGSLIDVMIDTAGLLTGFIFVYVLIRYVLNQDK